MPAIALAAALLSITVYRQDGPHYSASSGPPPEAGPRWLPHEDQETWVAVLGLLLLPGVLDSQLQRDAGLNLFDYLVLSSLSRLSNVASRLERRGWLRRCPEPANGRYTNATLTEDGWDLVVRAAPGHVAAVRHYVTGPLTATQSRTLRAAAERILSQVREV